jgi:P27 family predicted phage terminase small subunit
MKKGRRPKPSLLKISEGNRGKRRVKIGADLPAAPFEPPFRLDGLAKREWERIVAKAYWLRETESLAIADRCLCFERMLEAEQDIRQRGTIIRTRNGKVANPSIRIARSYRLSIQRYDAELGLTASSRARVDEDGLQRRLPIDPIDPIERKLCELPN